MNAVYDRDIKLSLVHPDLWMNERTMLMKMGGAINGAPGNMQQGKNHVGYVQHEQTLLRRPNLL